MKQSLLTFCLICMICACATAQLTLSDPKETIIAANKKFMEIFNKGTAGIIDLYATDAELYPPNSDALKGTAIGTYWKGGFDMGIKNVKLETISADSAGDHIVETGKYTLAGADGKTIDFGKYMVIWKKEKGEWKLFKDIWNTSVAAK